METLVKKYASVIWRGLVLVALVAIAYAPIYGGGFVWDDPLLIDKNPLVLQTLTWRTIWFQVDFPLTEFVLWLEWLAWGKNPLGYHIVNVALHAVGCLLVWRVLARLRVRAAWCGALLFALHPVGVASAGWISELKNVLSLPFFLLSLDGFLEYESHAARSSRAKASTWLAVSLPLFVLALFSKTSTVVLPLILLLCCWWNRGRISREDVRRSAPFFVLALGFGLLSVWFQAHQAGADAAWVREPLAVRLLGVGAALWFYVFKALVPLNLCFIYPRWNINPHWLGWYLPGLLWVGCLLLSWNRRKSWGRPLFFTLACFSLLLFPVLGFFDMYFLAISRVSDHFQYLGLIALCALVAAALRQSLGIKWSAVATGVLAAGLAVLTFQRAKIVGNEERLWRDTLARNPQAWTACNNLGCLLAEQGKYDDARAQFETAIQLNEHNAQAHGNLGRLLALEGQPDQALEHFRTALNIKPGDADVRRSFGSVLKEQGKIAEALVQYQEALRLEPSADTRMELAGLYCQVGKAREAIEQYHKLLLVQPDSREALNNLAWLLATLDDGALRDGKEAVALAERANRLAQEREAVPWGTLAAAYAEAGRFKDAVAAAQKARDLASTAGQEQLVFSLDQLLELYQAGKPFHQPLTPR